MRIDPCKPFAGRDVSFAMTGLQPWQGVKVEFIGPQGQPVPWITEYETEQISAAGVPLTEKILFSSESGNVEWIRIATKDKEGIWSARITIGEQTASVSYSVKQLSLPLYQGKDFVVKFEGIQGPTSQFFYTDSVPPALVVDLQSHAEWVGGRLNQQLGLESDQFVRIHFAGNKSILDQLAEATQIQTGGEAGYFLAGQFNTGIYMRADMLRTKVQMLLTHEYVHLLLYDLEERLKTAGSLPIGNTWWLHEGTATYYQYILGLQGEHPDATRAEMYRSADLAKSAAVSGETVSPPNTYAEAHMFMRYLTDTYGPNAPVAIAESRARGVGWYTNPVLGPNVMQEVFGLSYRDLNEHYAEWLKSWEDPEREVVRKYIIELRKIMDGMSAILSRRESDLQIGTPLDQQTTTRKILVSDAEKLSMELVELAPPAELEMMHSSGMKFTQRVIQWLTLELDYAASGKESKLTQANGMIGEIDARQYMLMEDIGEVEFIYHLQDS